MANDLAALQVRLDLQTAAFEKGMKQATTSMGRLERRAKQTNTHMATIQKTMGRMGKTAVGLAAGLASAFTVRQVKSAIEFGDAIAKVADSVGLSTETLQEYRFAAERSGVGTSLLESSMTAFVKRVGELKAETGPLVTGLKNIDQELINNLKNSTSQEQALGLLADRIQKSASSTERAALANAAFGRSGIKMVNMLKDGNEGLEEFARQARNAGTVLENDLTRKAEVLNDKWDTLAETIKVKLTTAFIIAADAVTGLFGSYNDLASVQSRIIELEDLILAAEIRKEAVKGRNAKGTKDGLKLMQEELDNLRKQEAQFIRTAKARAALNEPLPDVAGNSGSGLTDYEKALQSYSKSVMSAQLNVDTFSERLEILDNLYFDGAINVEVYEQKVAALTGSMKTVEKSAETLGDKMSVAFGNTLSDGVGRLVDNIMDADASFKDFAKNFIKDVTAMIAKMLILNSISSTFGLGGGAGFAKGGAFNNGVQFFANGGLVGAPTAFGMAGGRTGVMGEAGPEAILPLKRGSSGDLGVQANVSVNVTNNATGAVDVNVQRSGPDEVEIVINRITNDILRGGSRLSDAMETAYGVNRARGRM